MGLTQPSSPEDLLNIGQVVGLLEAEFPGLISIPKIRMLEADGLIKPDRTESGYRKFSRTDLERLRYILRMQRDHYLPRKVIAEHLDAMDRGLEPPPLQALVPTVPEVALSADGMPTPDSFRRRDSLRLSRRELLKTADITEALLVELESFGLITPRRGTQHYDTDALLVARTVRQLGDFGIEPRHLRGVKAAAEREVGLVEQVVAPHRKQGDPAAEGRVAEVASEIAALSIRLHATLVKSGLSL
jgi:DNA-binding transcriptional MerR regulator